MKRRVFSLFASALLVTTVAQAEPSRLDANQQDRYRDLIAELRCLVCQNQNIAESNAPLAQDLRIQVEAMIRDGRSDAEIKQYMTERYGDFVLYRPPLRQQTLALWLFPPLLLVAVLAIVWLRLRRNAT